jgi:hypothetical protein
VFHHHLWKPLSSRGAAHGGGYIVAWLGAAGYLVEGASADGESDCDANVCRFGQNGKHADLANRCAAMPLAPISGCQNFLSNPDCIHQLQRVPCRAGILDSYRPWYQLVPSGCVHW